MEYDLVGTHTTTGVTATARFIGVLRTDQGRITLWREYQNRAAIEAALAGS